MKRSIDGVKKQISDVLKLFKESLEDKHFKKQKEMDQIILKLTAKVEKYKEELETKDRLADDQTERIHYGPEKDSQADKQVEGILRGENNRLNQIN